MERVSRFGVWNVAAENVPFLLFALWFIKRERVAFISFDIWSSLFSDMKKDGGLYPKETCVQIASRLEETTLSMLPRYRKTPCGNAYAGFALQTFQTL